MPKCILKIFLFSLTWLILSQLSFSGDSNNVRAQLKPLAITTTAQVTISASIGEPVLHLWGYGPPASRIEISGRNVQDFTYSETDGYFEFKNAFLPSPTDSTYPELCLTAVDPSGRATPPTCIPGITARDLSYDIGPVILPPTLSLESESVAPGVTDGAEGITIPNSKVKIVLAEDSSKNTLSKFSLVETAKAYYIPDYTVTSDDRGYFSFNMPDGSPQGWRVFAITNYSQGATSPKSNTLKFEVVSTTTVFIKGLWAIILSLLTLPALIAAEIAIIILIILAITLKKKGRRKVYPTIADPIKEYQEFLKSRQFT
jgi:hypothetical protein